MSETVLPFLLAILPVAFLMVALAVFKMPALRACALAFVLGAALAGWGWHTSPGVVASAAAEGVCTALWPICGVIAGALYTYAVTVESGAMETIRKMLESVSSDTRVMMLLIAWGFGNFMEGMAGFGTAVAIPAAILAGIGVNPFKAVVCCLIANTTPTAFGSVAVPLVTLGSVTGLDVASLAREAVLLQLPVTLLTPALMLFALEGRQAFRGLGVMFTSVELAFGAVWVLTVFYVSPELADILAGLAVMVAVAVCAGKPKLGAPSPKAMAKAWAPFGFVVLALGLVALVSPLRTLLDAVSTRAVICTAPGAKPLVFKWLSAPGAVIFAAATVGGLVQGLSLRRLAGVMAHTLKRYWKSLATICAVLALARVMTYGGMIAALAAFLIHAAGSAYPAVAPLVGALGGFVTGSGTSSCVLFGGLQAETARELALSPVGMAAANVFGAGIGKMICPQSIAIGAGAAGLAGRESDILRKVLPYWAFVIVLAALGTVLGAFLA